MKDGVDQFLQSQSEDGSLQSKGSFTVDFSRARSKQSRYTLPKPELWVLRLLQALSRLGASRVDFKLSRKSLTASAVLENPPSFSSLELFSLEHNGDPRQDLQDTIWGALNRTLKVRLELGDSVYEIENDTIQHSAQERNRSEFKLRVEPGMEGGLIYKLFGKADFSGEFKEISQAGFLAPYALHLDGRPYDFASECAGELTGDYSEVRVQAAREGPRIRTAPHLKAKLSNTFDYRFLLQIRWKSTPRAALAHWVKHGIRLESSPLRNWGSQLWLDLYLPADGLGTDLTRINLIKNDALRERLQQLERFAVFSLLTTAPAQTAHQSMPSRVLHEVEKFAEDVLQRENIKRTNRAYFKNEVKEHRNRSEIFEMVNKKAMDDWMTMKHFHEVAEELRHDIWKKENPDSAFDALAASAAFGAEKEEFEAKPFEVPRPKRKGPGDFLGEVYVRLPRPPSTPDEPMPKINRKKSSRFQKSGGREVT